MPPLSCFLSFPVLLLPLPVTQKGMLQTVGDYPITDRM